MTANSTIIFQFHLSDDGVFPNSHLPVLLYKGVLKLPFLFPATDVKDLFASHGWTNAWDSGIFTYHHYHSITHEVLGVYKGETILKLGGEKGVEIKLAKGDVLIIPAGVAHKNLGNEMDVHCVGAYPDGRRYDINIGQKGERPQADRNIAHVELPHLDPVYGLDGEMRRFWK